MSETTSLLPPINAKKLSTSFFNGRTLRLLWVNLIVLLFTLTSIGEPTRKTLRFKLACNSLQYDHGNETANWAFTSTNYDTFVNGCNSKDVQMIVSDYNQYGLVVGQLSLVFALANIGRLSNRYGRKFFMMIIVGSLVISRLVLLAVMVHYQRFMMKLFLMCDAIAMCGGGILGLLGLADTYVSAVVGEEGRSRAMGYVHGAVFAGGTLGPLLSNVIGEFLKGTDEMEIITGSEKFMFELEIAIFLVVLGVVVTLPSEKTSTESTEEDSESEMSEADKGRGAYNILISLVEPLKTLVTPDKRSTYSRTVLHLVAVNTVLMMFEIVVGEISVDYAIYKFHWDTKTVSQLLITVSSARVVVLYIIFPLYSGILKRVFTGRATQPFNHVDFVVVCTGLIFNLFLYLGLSLSTTTLSYLGSVAVGSINTVIQPTLQSVILKYYNENRVAEVLLALSMVNGVCNIFAPMIFVKLYQMGLSYGVPMLTFLVCAGVDILAVGVVIVAKIL